MMVGMTDEEIGRLTGPLALARKREVEARLREIKGDLTKLEEREFLKREDNAIVARLKAYKEENKRRAFAGMGTPLYEALVEFIDDDEVLTSLELAALEKLAERERVSAERKAGKASGRPSSGRPEDGGRGGSVHE